jgi:hypothetical protein
MLAARAVAAAVSVALMAGGSRSDAKPPKVPSLAACPAWGAEKPGTSRALLNEVKHQVPPAGTPTLLTFADVAALQRQGDARVASGVDAVVLAADRAKLQNLAVAAGRVGEGALVSMVGFIVGKPSANQGESANCFLPGPANNDFEFTLAPAADATRYDGIVCEMIPQDRPSAWTIGRLRAVAAVRQQVLVVGQLMFDTRHVPNPRKGTNDDTPRMSTWEIHPVTRLLVCPQRAGACDPSRESQWQPIESIQQ